MGKKGGGKLNWQEKGRKKEGKKGDLRKMLECNLICSPILLKELESTDRMIPIPDQGKKHGNQVTSD